MQKRKNIVITGATKGIGFSLAVIFAEPNTRLLLCARNKDELGLASSALTDAEQDVEVHAFCGDLSDKATTIEFAAWCNQYGATDILINNVGTFIPGDVSTEADGSIEKMMDTNFYSAYHLTRALLPKMIEAGSGHIFNICSVAALKAYDGGGSYSISKFAMDGLSQNLRSELKDKNIKVTAVFPGAVMTNSWKDFDNSDQRIMEPEDVAIMVKAATLLSTQSTVEEIVMRPQLGDLP